jgi:hypothetical protein
MDNHLPQEHPYRLLHVSERAIDCDIFWGKKKMPEPTLVITFTPSTPPTSVLLAHSLDNWESRTPLLPISPNVWATPLSLPHSAEPLRIEYKFVVDGEWMLDTGDDSKLQVVDSSGNVNHLVVVEFGGATGDDTLADIDVPAPIAKDIKKKSVRSRKQKHTCPIM